MPEEYEPALSAYESAAGIAVDLTPVDLTEEEINSALDDLFNG